MLSETSPADEMATLYSVDLFQNLSSSEIDTIARLSSRGVHETGSFLFHQGDPAKYLYILLDGRLKLTQVTTDGQQVLIRFIGPGETFAVVAVLRNRDYPVAAEIIQPCKSLFWDRRTMKRLMSSYPTLERNALEIMADRVREFQDRVRELATERVERRIARALLRLTRQAGRRVDEGVLIDFPLSRQDLAEMAGTTLYTVSRTLKQWELQGLVKTSRTKVIISYPHGLVLIAEDLPADGTL